MIFVSVGTNEARFDRLLRAVERLPVGEEILVQHGHSCRIERPGLQLVDFLPFEGMIDAVRRARAVVTHAGVGSVMVALANGKRPIVVPRRGALGEAVDDHQLQLGRRFRDAGLVTLVESEDQLEAALGTAELTTSVRYGANALAADIRGYVAAAVGARRP